MRQRALDIAVEPPAALSGSPAAMSGAQFVCGDRSKLFVGEAPLHAYLRSSGQQFVLRLAERIDAMELGSFLERYSPVGRPAIHPRIMLGLIFYGTIIGHSSLRALEHLAICDVRAWWLCGGEQPDHSTIGKFVVAHRDWLISEGFTSAFKAATTGLRVQSNEAAIDGTVIESVASRLNMLTREAAREAAEEARRVAAVDPSDTRMQAAASTAEQVARAADQRADRREDKGLPADYVKVAASDPDAVNQPRKDDVRRPAYKPSVIATHGQLISGQHVEPSSETAAIPALLEQHKETLGEEPTRVLADAGYCAIAVLALAIEKQIDLLCPEGQGGSRRDLNRNGQFQKHLFVFQPDDEAYRCPAGQTLVPSERGKDRGGRPFTKYRCDACRDCPQRAKCTDAKSGRSIKRYEGDDLKEALREVMKQPAARAKYRERSAMVEPIFGRLRAMGLHRFRRRGLARVRAEFAICCIAYNFKRADGIREARIAAFAFVHSHHAGWTMVLLITTGTRHSPT
jgi:transposase